MKSLIACSLLALPAAFAASAPTTTSASTSTSTEPRAESAAYVLDAVHSSAVFRAWHMGIAHFYGSFDKLSGEVTIDEDEPANSTVRFVIDAGSVHSGHPGRDKHLMATDFFNAKEFPEMVFESSKVKKRKDGWTVDGELTVRGVSRPLTVEVDETGRGDTHQGFKIGLAAEFDIDMAQFDMPAMEKMTEDMLGRKVTIMLGVQLKQK